jgi:CBS domain containing-hemolysin-like protein
LNENSLKGISPNGIFNELSSTLHDFLINEKKRVNRTDNFISITQKDTYDNLIDLFVQHHAHRIFLVDETNKPVGVVSLVDLIDKLKNFD